MNYKLSSNQVAIKTHNIHQFIKINYSNICGVKNFIIFAPHFRNLLLIDLM
jgi:hypothetical protein